MDSNELPTDRPTTIMHTPEFQQGVRAGIVESSCPFDRGTIQQLCWFEGFKFAKAQLGTPVWAMSEDDVARLNALPAPLNFESWEEQNSKFLQFLKTAQLD